MSKVLKVALLGLLFVAAVVGMTYQQYRVRVRYEANAYSSCVGHALSAEEKHNCVNEVMTHQDFLPWWYILYTWPEGISTWAIITTAAFIAWQSLETRKAAEATSSAADTAATDLSISARAWVSARVIQHLFQVGSRLIVLVEFENTGDTPAVNVRTCLTTRLLDDSGHTPELSYPEERFSQGSDVIMPRQAIKRRSNALGSANEPAVTRDGLLDSALAEELRASKKTVVAFGVVEYEDIFGRKHWTKFCLRLVIKSAGPFRTQGISDWARCSLGNDIDRGT